MITLYLSKFTQDQLEEFLYQLALTLGQHLLIPTAYLSGMYLQFSFYPTAIKQS